MRNLAKYFLVLAVMVGGFYAAQQDRQPNGNVPNGNVPNGNVPNGNVPNGTVAGREPTAEPSNRGGQRPLGAAAATTLPVAALADVDRVPLLGSDRPTTPGKSTLPETASVTKQPTLRVDGPAEKSSSADSAKKPGPDATNVDSKKQTEAKSKPRKQNSKKAATAKAQDKDFIPPELAHEYRTHAERFEIGKEPNSKEPNSKEPGESERQDAASSETATTQTAPREAPPAETQRRHRIAEGDTLARLAEKYLGSRDRYLDLFQANAEVLFDPKLIPIGVEIVIPDRTTIVAQGP